MVTQTSHDFTVGGDYTRMSIPKGKAHRGPSWRLVTTPNKPRHPITSAKHKDWGPWPIECSQPHSNTAYTSAPNGCVLHQGPKQGFCLLPNLFMMTVSAVLVTKIYSCIIGKIRWRRDRLPTPVFLGFPCGSADKESTCNVGDLGSIPGLGRSPGEGKGYPLQYSGLENSMDCIVHGVTKSQTDWATLTFTISQ